MKISYTNYFGTRRKGSSGSNFKKCAVSCPLRSGLLLFPEEGWGAFIPVKVLRVPSHHVHLLAPSISTYDDYTSLEIPESEKET